MRFKWKLDFTQYSVSSSDFPYRNKNSLLYCQRKVLLLLCLEAILISSVPGLSTNTSTTVCWSCYLAEGFIFLRSIAVVKIGRQAISSIGRKCGAFFKVLYLIKLE